MVRKFFTSLAFVLILPISAQAHDKDLADLVDKLLPSVVNISSTQAMEDSQPDAMSPFQDMPQFPPGSPFHDFFEDFMNRHAMPNQAPGSAIPQASLGSGFVIDAENGYIITNNHVISEADEIRVTFSDDRTVQAELIGRDEKTDLAVLKIEETEGLVDVKLGDSDLMRVGHDVVAIGNPFGLGGTVTAGIISARQRNIHAGPYDDFIQTDASINRGNSGGPMFNMDGEVIGINTAIYSPSGGSVGIGFAIPSALAKPVIDQIIKYGRTRRGWLGVRIQSVTDEIADSLGLDTARGALVASLSTDGPAIDAGIKPGDVILSFNGEPIREMRELPRVVAETEIGKNVPVTVWRKGKIVEVRAELGELEKAEENGQLAVNAPDEETEQEPKVEGKLLGKTGMRVTPLTDDLRMRFDIKDDVSGLVVMETEDDSPAYMNQIFPGDVISEIGQAPVSNVKEANKQLRQAIKDGKEHILLLVNRQGDIRFIALEINEE